MKRLKYLLLMIVCVAVLLCIATVTASADVIASGKCGDNVTYSLDDNGTLIISGTGNMTDYNRTYAPWYSLQNNIKRVVIEDGVTSIGRHVFYWCTSLTSITIPDGVTSIGYSAFNGCTSLTSITIPDSIASIGGYAFFYCTSLTSIIIPNSIISIGDYAFSDCKSLTSITIPDSVTSIGWDAFSGCKSLTSITILDGVTSIGNYAFEYCTSLTSITIPASITYIGDYVFSDCPSLRCVIYNGTYTQWKSVSIEEKGNYALTNANIYCFGDGSYRTNGKAICNKNGTMLIYHYENDRIYIVPEGVKSIEQKAFSDSDKLVCIILPEGLKNIGSYAMNSNELKSVYIPASAATIDQYAFYYCEKFSDIFFGGTKEQFEAIQLGSNNSYFKNAAVHYNTRLVEKDGVIYTEDMKTLVAVSSEKSGLFEIPSSVTKISAYAFDGCSKLAEIKIPESVMDIGEYAFNNCDGIKSIKLPTGIAEISNHLFSDCDGLEEITIHGNISSIGNRAFYSCDKLNSVVLDSGLVSIGDEAFRNCISIEALALPETLVAIGKYTFSGCLILQDIYFPSALKSIGNYAFSENSALTYISLPDSVSTIGAYAFYNCKNLEDICLPEGELSAIPANTFNGSAKLTNIYIPKNITSCGDSAFLGCDSLSDIYYAGTEDEWNKISIFSSNSVIWAANVHFNHSHTNSPWNAVSATCISIGYTEGVTCEICNKNVSGHKRLPIDNSNHVNTKNIAGVKATCTTVGYTAGVYCNDCAKYISGHEEIGIDANAHKWDNGTITTTATCKVNGVKTYTCQHNASHTKTESLGVNASNHVNTKNVAEVKAICTTKGSTAGVYCNDCEKYISGHEEIGIDTDAHKWDNGTITTTATCKVNGVKTYTCEYNSEHTYTEDLGLDASNHVNTMNTEATAPTCSAVGYTDGVYCNDCQKYVSGHAEIAINADAHKWDNGKITTVATCKMNGVKTYTCEYDENHTFTEDLGLNVSNHVNTMNTEATAPTCSEVGYTAGVYCNDCEEYISGHTEIGIDTKAHSWDNGTITTTANCNVNGVKTYTCQHNSAHKKTEDLGVNASNHVNTKDVAEVKATCTTTGYTAGIYCNDCQKYISGHTEIAVDANAHTLATDKAVAATCTTAGKTDGSHCSACNTVIKAQENIPAIGHTAVTDKGTVATCTTAGKSDGSHCSACNTVIKAQENIPAKGHTAVTDKGTAATCTTAGKTDGSHCSVCNAVISAQKDVPALGHKWDNGTITTTATCKVNGVKTYTCQHNASHTKTESLGVNASNHVNTKNVAEVKATCTTKGYSAGVYCNDCQKYISGHAEIAINTSNHVNTKNVAEVPATTEKVGYTAGVYCNDCKKYVSGHKEIAKIEVSFTDSADAKESGNNILANCDLSAEKLLSQAGKSATLKTADGKAVEKTALIGTGMILTLADGSKKELVVYGDVDGDGKISAADARLALRASVGLENYKEGSCYYKAANVESKDKMSASDARLILRASVGLEDPKQWLK